MATKGKWITSKATVSLQNCFTDFINEKKALDKSAATIASYQHTWKKYLSVMGEVLTESSIFQYISILKDRDLKSHSINHNLRELRTFVNWCIEKQYIPAFKMKMIKEEEVIQQTYSEKEMITMAQKPVKNDSFAEWRTWARECTYFRVNGNNNQERGCFHARKGTGTGRDAVRAMQKHRGCTRTAQADIQRNAGRNA